MSLKRYKEILEKARQNGEIRKPVANYYSNNRKPIATKSKVDQSGPKPVEAQPTKAIDPNRIQELYRLEQKKKLAQLYTSHRDPCAHIGSVGNGL